MQHVYKNCFDFVYRHCLNILNVSPVAQYRKKIFCILPQFSKLYAMYAHNEAGVLDLPVTINMIYLIKLNSRATFIYFFVGCFTCASDSFELVYWDTWRRSQRWGSIDRRNLVTGQKTLLAVGETQTQVLADSMANAASAPNHYATQTNV